MRFITFHFTIIFLATSFLSFVVVNSCNANSFASDSTHKPHIHIIATGGTIAGAGSDSVESTYEAGKIGIGVLLKSLPGLGRVATLSSEQPVNIGSQEMDETAFFLSLAVRCRKPIIMVGAVRPSSRMSADGPLNLYNAVVAASDGRASQYGVSVVMNDLIFSAIDIEKTNTIAVDAFKAPNGAPYGYFSSGKLFLTQNLPLHHNLLGSFELSNINKLPKVGIVYGYAGVDEAAVEGYIAAGYKGIVYARVGDGNLSGKMLNYLTSKIKNKIVVVRSSRVLSGGTMPDGEVDDTKYGFLVGGRLSPQKCRVLLMLSMACQQPYLIL